MIDRIMAQPMIGGGKKKPQRQVNIELLRMLSMFLVLIIHWNVPINGHVEHDMVIENPLKAFGIAMTCGLEFIAVNCFMVISGYFGIRWKWMGFLKFFFQIAFWSVMVYLVAVAIGFSDWSVARLIERIVNCMAGNWFFMSYAFVYMLAPMVNAFVEKAGSRMLGGMLLAFALLQVWYGWIFKAMPEFYDGLHGPNLLFYYMMGAWLKVTDNKWTKLNKFCDLGVYVGIALLLAVACMVTRYMGATKDVFSYISPMAMMQTMFLFLFFKKLKVSDNDIFQKYVLFLSSSVFAVLLLHSWEAAGWYGMVHRWIYDNLPMPAVWSLCYICVFFVVACCLDKVRLFVWNRISVKCFK